jgi:hypothetical protein
MTRSCLFLGFLVITTSLAACAEGTPPSPTGSASGTGGTGGTGSTGTGGTGNTGACVTAEDCPPTGDPCTEPSCINSECKTKPAHEGAACDDGDWCTDDDSCVDGLCTGGTTKYCPPSDSCHVGKCDSATKSCGFAPGNDGAQCDDNDPCTGWGSCSGGTCQKGTKVDCSFLDGTCAVGVCDPQTGCVQQPLNDGAPCNDGLFCTINDTCNGGACKGDPNPCAPPNNPCLIGVCNENTNSCTTTPGNNGAACDDGNLCTTGETCSNGTCGGGQATNEGVACDDGDGCTQGTTCENGACGSAANTITACIDNDTCCPANCPLDLDCKTDVLVLHADDPFNAQDVQDTLVATGAFTGVDLFDGTINAPTLALLQGYQAVLVYSNIGFSDPVGVGNVLADFFDAGGRVVLSPGANCSDQFLGSSGRFITDGYAVAAPGPIDMAFGPDSMGVVFEPQSPLMAGVNFISAQLAARCFVSPSGGSTTVASWSAGLPLVVRGTVNGKNRVDLNLFPVSDKAFPDLWVGDGAALLKNALLYK